MRWVLPVSCREPGYTLVEMLVVMAIVGMLTGLVGPSLFKLVQRGERAAQRQSLLSEIQALGYRAYSEGRSIKLDGIVEHAEPAGGGEDANAPPFLVPEGWRVQIKNEISYNFNGMCSGGELVLLSPDGDSETLELKPPRCRIFAAGTPDR